MWEKLWKAPLKYHSITVIDLHISQYISYWPSHITVYQFLALTSQFISYWPWHITVYQLLTLTYHSVLVIDLDTSQYISFWPWHHGLSVIDLDISQFISYWPWYITVFKLLTWHIIVYLFDTDISECIGYWPWHRFGCDLAGSIKLPINR